MAADAGLERSAARPAGMSATLAAAAAAILLVGGTTFLHGRLTDRWTPGSVSAELERAASLLESRFPQAFGDWQVGEELDFNQQELERAGAVGHIARAYFNAKSKAKLSVFVVCATPANASGHTPDRCYPGAGFEIAETEHRQAVTLADGRSAEVFTGTFRKAGQTIRVYWTYGVGDRWLSPAGIARIALGDYKAVYKLYAIIEETNLPSGVGARVCADFLAGLLPAFDASLGEAG